MRLTARCLGARILLAAFLSATWGATGLAVKLFIRLGRRLSVVNQSSQHICGVRNDNRAMLTQCSNQQAGGQRSEYLVEATLQRID